MTCYELTDWTLIAPEHPDVPQTIRALELAASVPGCVHTDLLAHNLIPDPYYGTNENEVQWIGLQDWQYRTRFTLSAEMMREKLEFVCEGLDTVALELNGKEVGKSETMHAAHRFDLTAHAKEGENDLIITFHSAIRYAEEQRERIGYLPTSEYPIPFNFIRKMACNFGWDWGPTLVTAGIWQPIYLGAHSGIRLASVRPLVMSASEEVAEVDVHVDVDGDIDGNVAGLELVATLFDPDGEEVVTQTSSDLSSPLNLTVESPQLWYPRGYGEQPLYRLETELRQGEEVVDSRDPTHRFALR